ncbi:MAG: hypothetical protein K2H76_01225 [Muribaculaceae bacterium]|nr:hypothetical protein [Muribaculaceae bacterium]
MIKPWVDSTDSKGYSIALTYAAFIALDLKKYDSARMYSRMILNRKEITNKKNAYGVLLHPEMEGVENIDSVKKYATAYRQLLDDEKKRNEDQKALLQYTRYNYQIHEREREKAERKNKQLTNWLYITVIMAMLFALLHGRQLLRKKNRMLRFYDALTLVYLLQKRQGILGVMENQQSELIRNDCSKENSTFLLEYRPSMEDPEATENKIDIEETPRSLKEKLTQELMFLESSVSDKYLVPDSISQSEIYEKMRKAIDTGATLINDETFWNELERAVVSSSPSFIRNLTILLGGKLKRSDRQMALLIKCGVSPTEMKTILKKEKGSISSHRTTLGLKAFDIKMSTKRVDKLIRLL